MRVIAGTARSLPLKCIEGLSTRPTTDRIKETLFNMIQQDIPGCRFLDLFAGSGSIGIEALSRGAKEAVFVENQKKALACVKDNLSFTRLSDRARVLFKDAVAALYELKGEPAFDIIFLDPPYNQGLEQQVLAVLRDSSLVNEDTMVILETSKDSDMDWIEDSGFAPWKIKNYKTNQHLFLRYRR
ncbi:MAG: 16S rRNA (guanine(966)-N(2))-methyltransferase RsmD [Lachnospiraceae bacterium]|uniref:16S rRNA (guanine(966)-N(2))-methyltransferase RsmD n=1 Tax=Candidatus Merdisoma sp. JLR.KK006 TaxID=3112626 RepID=UPI002FF17D3A|nr:16S rRNA (guanine(966)-N(2))-methyltransferase RsmD [Lachnospiraceae bacterium]